MWDPRVVNKSPFRKKNLKPWLKCIWTCLGTQQIDSIKFFFKTVDFRPIVRVDDQAPWDAADATVCTILHTYIHILLKLHRILHTYT